jgi:hypothetical protein
MNPTETFNPRECDGRTRKTRSWAGWCVGFDASFWAYPGSGSHILLQSRLTDGATGYMDAEARLGRRGFHAVFLGNGMTSQDTLGTGATANIGTGANATVNTSIPNLRQPWNMKVSSIEGGLGLPGFAVTTTYTPQQIADWIISRGMGPHDELTPFERSLQSKNGSVGANVAPAVCSA